MKGLFLKSLEIGWRTEKAKGLKEINRQHLIDSAMKMLKTLGDTQITEEDLSKVIDKVWGKGA